MTTPQKKALRPCVFFDRDGIVNRSPGPGYVERVEDFHLLPEFLDALRVAAEKGYAAVIISNQRGVGRGLMTLETLEEIHRHLTSRLAEQGLEVLDIFACTVDQKDHPDRKPNPGMILRAAERHGLDLARSWMVGDQESDVEAGARAGCRTVLVREGRPQTKADFQVDAMEHLAGFLGQHLNDLGRSALVERGMNAIPLKAVAKTVDQNFGKLHKRGSIGKTVDEMNQDIARRMRSKGT